MVVVVWDVVGNGEEKEGGRRGEYKGGGCGTGKWRRRWCSTARPRARLPPVIRLDFLPPLFCADVLTISA